MFNIVNKKTSTKVADLPFGAAFIFPFGESVIATGSYSIYVPVRVTTVACVDMVECIRLSPYGDLELENFALSAVVQPVVFQIKGVDITLL